MDIHGCPLISMDLHGCPWMSMDVLFARILHHSPKLTAGSKALLIMLSYDTFGSHGSGKKELPHYEGP